MPPAAADTYFLQAGVGGFAAAVACICAVHLVMPRVLSLSNPIAHRHCSRPSGRVSSVMQVKVSHRWVGSIAKGRR